MRTLFLSFSFLFIFLISCKQDDGDPLEKTNSYDVYLAGSENLQACYWKNGVKTVLPNGNNLIARNIFVENNNVYATASTALYLVTEYFWKNGTRYDIAQYLNIPNNVTVNIHDYKVENNDIYFSGYIENPNAPVSERYELCYWKNAVKVSLHKQSFVMDSKIDVVNSQVYVSTSKYDPVSGYNFGYFQNTTFHSIAPEIYTLGNMVHNNNGVYILYQKNLKLYQFNIASQTETLIGPYELPFANTMEITPDPSNNNLYTNYKVHYYYKNSVQVLNSDQTYPTVTTLKAYDDNIFIVKETTSGPKSYNFLINNIQTQTIGNGGFFTSLFVVKN